MAEHLNSAINELHAKLKEQEQSVIETKQAINLLRKMSGEDPLFTDEELNKSPQNIQPDQYYGKPLATAAREYLQYRKKACRADDIISGLEKGGFDFEALDWGKDDRQRLRVFSMSLAKNSTTFHRLPNGTYGLLDWYPTKKKTKTKKARNQEVPETEEVKEQEEEEINNLEKANIKTESDQ